MRSNAARRRRRVGLAVLVIAVGAAATVGTAAPAGGAASQPAPAPEVTVTDRTYADPHGFNERGQVFGLSSADNSSELIRTLWEVQPS